MVLAVGAGLGWWLLPAELSDTPPETLEVEVAGCAAVVSPMVCELAEDRQLQLWVAGAAGQEVVVLAGAEPLTPEASAEVQGGRSLRVQVPPGVDLLIVRAERPGGHEVRRVPVVDHVPIPLLDEVRALRREQRYDDALRRLDDGEPTLPESARGRAMGLRARLRLSQGHFEAALRDLRASIARHRADGRLSDVARDSFAAVYTLNSTGWRFEEARQLLAEIPLAVDESRARRCYYGAIVARDRGDLRSALELLTEAEARVERLGLTRLGRDTRQVKANILLHLGRTAEALQTLETIRSALPADVSACYRALVETNIGWVRLEQSRNTATRIGVEGGDPMPPLRRSIELYRSECPRPERLANALLNLAAAELLYAKRPGAARALLVESRALLPEAAAYIATWWRDLEGRIALAEGDAAASLATYEALDSRAAAAAATESRWRAQLGRGRSLEQLGRQAEALTAYRSAEALLDHAALEVPLGAGRGSFLATREDSARQLADLLLRMALPREALAAAQRARGRARATVQRIERVRRLDDAARTRWQLAIAEYRQRRAALDTALASLWTVADDALELRVAELDQDRAALQRSLDTAFEILAEAEPPPPKPPPAGVVSLTYFAGAEGWLGFAERGQSVVGRALGPLPPLTDRAALAQTLLAPFRDVITGADLLRVHAYGAAGAVDVHALPWDGGALVEATPVVYALGSRSATERPGPGDTGAKTQTALVIADPRGNLPGARAEAEFLAGRLERHWKGEVVALTGARATGADVRAALAGAAFAHYAGHGVFEGSGGWDGGLLLAGNGRLTIADVLALARSPRQVVLSGCETGRLEGGEGLGLAHAFLAVGTETVIASVREVPDALSLRLVELLYEELTAEGFPEPARALQRAQIALLRSDADSDWATWRVFEP